jgi:AcrR family transcriptional regulator
VVPTRRERLRAELTKEILDVAGQQLAERGPGGVSWRGIAREVGMNPASLYTYFDRLDDLFTALILQAFEALADAVRTASDRASDEAPIDHLIACSSGYRSWAIENPARFNLIFSDQIPGYVAPADGPTTDAEIAVFEPMNEALGRLIGTNEGPVVFGELAEDEQDLQTILYATLHGLVTLEINHHFPPGQDHGARFEERLRRAIATLA